MKKEKIKLCQILHSPQNPTQIAWPNSDEEAVSFMSKDDCISLQNQQPFARNSFAD